ncbi:hypothetical protein AX16_009622 [Volvariella volvacea WC 439]|nr:hypothetical protein AX16_009622 [Volvariella volvacea WC 439]
MPSSTSSRQRPPSLPSTTSLNRATSTRSTVRPPPPQPNVVTSPPWARDEPPSPKEQSIPLPSHYASEPRPSDVASYISDASHPGSRWWSFTLQRPRQPLLGDIPGLDRPERKGFKDRSLSWLNPSSLNMSLIRKEREKSGTTSIPEEAGYEDQSSPSLPVPPQASTSARLSKPPGWEISWKRNEVASHNRSSNPSHHGSDAVVDDQESQVGSNSKRRSRWARRKRRLRNFVLTNTYVPLLFRFMNITFTTAALGMAIRIRQLEMRNNVMGAVGSSPTVVIIFAPLTLVHVMAAIYLEYFGRPLGLWRTSRKLAHTLSEVLFICAWSAALSLSFDNFFTSRVPCASPSHMAWYSQLPPPMGIPDLEYTVGERICDDQLSLICLVGIGLLMYCSNLVISLYRIFEKVKYHPAAPTRIA